MIPASVRIFVCTEPQNMRRGFDALALTVRQVLGEDPRGGAVFVFARSQIRCSSAEAVQRQPSNSASRR
jgi:hypothetical protein